MNELEELRSRTNEYIRQANQDRDTAVRTFAADLWSQLHYYFLEVCEDADADPHDLNAEQKMFRRRLREIKAVLAENGVR